LGFFLGLGVLSSAGVFNLALFQAFVVGTLLHVVFVHPPQGMSEETPGMHEASTWGALLGVGIALVMSQYFGAHGHEGHGTSSGAVFIHLALEAAPALVLAFFCAGMVHAFLKPKSLDWMSRGPKVVQSLKGMAFGLPLPICSCGALPVYKSLVEGKAAPAAALAFLVATPEIGLDAVLISLPLLGVEMTITRVIAAVVVALAVSWIVTSCTTVTMPETVGKPDEDAGKSLSFWDKVLSGLRYGYGELIDHILPWIVFGLLLAALADPLLHELGLQGISPVYQVVIAALAGIPFYVCASGSTPLVAVFLAQGLSPGAGIAFLLTGPATNVTTFGVLTQLHGRKVAAWFGGSMFAVSCLVGWLTNLLLPSIELGGISHDHGGAPSDLALYSLGLLAVVMLVSLLRNGVRGWLAQIHPSFAGHGHQEHGHDHDGHHGHGHDHEGHHDHAPEGSA
jgi:hypothetical protein